VATSNRIGKSVSTTTLAADDSPAMPAESLVPSQRSGKATETRIDDPAPEESQAGDQIDRAVTTADGVDHTAAIDPLQDPDSIVTLLRIAANEKDHTRIKQCLDDLVALGDAAVVGLNDLVNVGGEAGLWAAEALARIGTPMATRDRKSVV